MPQMSSNNRSFFSSVLAKLPYVDSAVMDADQNNPKYELFHRLSKNREMAVLKQSVITGSQLRNDDGNFSNTQFGDDKGYHQFIYAQIDADKVRRISEYRRMANYSEVSDCLDEICDEMLVKDENGKICKVKFNGNGRQEREVQEEISKEFYKFLNNFKLEEKGWGYFRQLLVEGELFFENVIHDKNEDKGIIGILNIPSELINPIYDNIQNNVIENFIFQKPIVLDSNDPKNLTRNNSYQNKTNTLQNQIVTMQGKQITYIHSGIWNEDQSVRLPFIESCRRAYKQLSLIEDSIVIYRLVRAPERLKFRIDVGNMPANKREAYLQQVKKNYMSKKTLDTDKGGGHNSYDPMSMLDSYFFATDGQGKGSDVELMPGGQNLGELADLNYFVGKLYKSLKVPLSRMNPTETFKDGSEILREELKFAKFVIRIQSHFAVGLKQSFITHLKLKSLWKENKLNESHFDVNFNPPSSYFALREQQLFELKTKNFGDLTANESISKTFAQRYYLEYNDSRISENMEWLRKDAALKWELDQIGTSGPNWREQLEATTQASTGGADGGGVDGGGSAISGGGGSSSSADIPEFGGGGGESAPEGEAGDEVPLNGPAPEGEAPPEEPVET